MEAKETPQKEEKIVDFVNRPKDGLIPPGLEEIRTPITSIYEDYIYLKPTTTLPTKPPVNPLDKFCLYDDGTNVSLYVFNSTTATWIAVGSGGSSGSIAGKMTITSGQSVPNITETVLNFDNAVIEEGITCDTTNHSFVIETAGVYVVHGQVGFYPGTASKIVNAIIEVNSAGWVAQSSSETGTATGFVADRVTYMGELEIGDVVTFKAYHNFGGSAVVQTPDHNTYFQINKI